MADILKSLADLNCLLTKEGNLVTEQNNDFEIAEQILFENNVSIFDKDYDKMFDELAGVKDYGPLFWDEV